jgi:leader peptidase (prepilin peptidase)/N-methyltransferase
MFIISFYIFSLFLSYTDCKRFIVPNSTLTAMLLMMIVFGFFDEKIYISSIVLCFLILLFFIVLLLVKPNMILGGGDIKYMIIVGFYLGIYNFPLFLIITGILQSLVLLYVKKRKKRKIAPMVPLMFTSVIIVDILVLTNIYQL